VARTRALALGDELARETTERASPRKQMALSLAYDKARRDAGFLTLAEQQAAQQQAQLQQMAAQAQERDAKANEAERGRQFTASQNDANRQAAADRATQTIPPAGAVAA
jgi:hypothetical protein